MANLLLQSYIYGTQDTRAGTDISVAWHRAIEEDRRRTLHALAHAVVALKKQGRGYREHVRGRTVVLGQSEHLSIQAHTVLLPKDCPLHLVYGEFQLAPQPILTNAQITEHGDRNSLQEMPAGECRDLLSDTISPAERPPPMFDINEIDEVERAWERVMAAVHKAKLATKKAK